MVIAKMQVAQWAHVSISLIACVECDWMTVTDWDRGRPYVEVRQELGLSD